MFDEKHSIPQTFVLSVAIKILFTEPGDCRCNEKGFATERICTVVQQFLRKKKSGQYQ